MLTHENELTSPVDLCTTDGDRLDRAALGWSRRPLHRANLAGRFGINKRWDYWAVLAGDLVLSCLYADVDHFGVSDVWWADLASGTTGGNGMITAEWGGRPAPDRATARAKVVRATYSLRRGDPLTAQHHGEEFVVRPGSAVSFPGSYRTHDTPSRRPAN